MKLRTAMAGVVLTATAGVAVWSLWPRAATQTVAGDEAKAGPQGSAAARVSSAGVAAVARQQRLLAGVYAVQYQMLLEAPAADAQGGLRQDKAELQLTGQLDVLAPLQDGGTWLPVRLRDVQVTANAAALQAAKLPQEGAAQVLQAVFVVAVQPDGRFGEARFAATTPTPARALLTGMVQAAQFVSATPGEVAAGQQVVTWKVVEADLNHSYEATYDQKSAQSVHKSWQVSADPSGASDSLPPGYKGQGHAEFAFVGNELASLRASQSGQVQLSKHMGVIRFETTTKLDRKGEAVADWARGLQPSALATFVPAAEAKVTRVASTRGMAAILQDVASAVAKKDWQARHRLGSELAGVIVANDRVAAEVGARLRQPATEPEQRTLLEALAEAGTPAAQTQLVGVAADAVLEMPLRTQALGAATFVKKPTDGMVHDLGAMAYDRKAATPAAEFPSNAAIAVAAAIGHQLAASGVTTSPAATQFVAEATERLAPETAPTQPSPPTAGQPQAGITAPTHVPAVTGRTRHNWIAAVGNAGLPETAPLLVGLLDDSDEFSRAAAALSMRFLPPPSVVPHLLKLWPTEDSIHVRQAILEACLYLGPGATKTLVQKALRYDKSEMVREAAAYTAAAWAQRTPALAELLQDALQHETSPQVAETIKNFLQPGRVAAPFRLTGGKVEAK
jgi:hypothetical protein